MPWSITFVSLSSGKKKAEEPGEHKGHEGHRGKTKYFLRGLGETLVPFVFALAVAVALAVGVAFAVPCPL
ncbi:MAG: hypothetical protein JOY77_09195 [Alphaproteobacteria bacterium]|nr:hypothetical protein [Alphaproteobacteria bacterium]MBV9438102.1 hypothetical protein [Acidobacteriota bacterium]